MSSIPMIRQTAGKGAAKAAAKRPNRVTGRPRNRGGAGGQRRPGALTYSFLGTGLLASLFPLYW